ncbi:MAG: T9SS type A sorting domain-containing protein [Chitinophagales bacterium]
MKQTLSTHARSIFILLAFCFCEVFAKAQSLCPIEASITSSGTLQFCEGGSVILTANPDGYCYLWSTGETSQSITIDASGTYSVTVSSCDGGGDACTIEAGQFRTQTQGGWGANPSGGNPGAYLHDHFDEAFPGGIQIGCDYTITLTSAAAVTAFLPQGSTAEALTASYTDPGSDNITVLAGQVLALAISVGFDYAIDDFSASDTHLANLIVGSGTFAGWTVGDVLEEGNKILGGCASDFTADEVNEVLSAINENFVDGTTAGSYLVCPETACSDEASETVTVYEYPDATTNPTGNIEICPKTWVTLYANDGDGLTYQWYRNGVPVVNGNGSSLTTKMDGCYTVTIVNEGGCSSTSAAINISILPAPRICIRSEDGFDICGQECEHTDEEGHAEHEFCVDLEAHSTDDIVAYQWYFNGVPIDGAIEHMFNASVPGSYTVKVTSSNGCSKRSNQKEVINTCKIGDITTDDINVYPNPTEGELFITLDALAGQSEVLMEVKDLHGRILQSGNITNEGSAVSAVFNFTSMPKGIYYISFITGETIIVKEIIVQ